MRPTDSSLGPPPWLVALGGLLGLVFVVCAVVPNEWLLGRVAFERDAHATSAARWTRDEELVNWEHSLPWMAVNRASAQPRIVVATDPLLPASRRLSREVLRDRWCAQQISQGFACSRVEANDPSGGVEAESADSVVAFYHVTTLPTILFLDRNGAELARITGYPGRNAVMAEVLARGSYPSRGYGRD